METRSLELPVLCGQLIVGGFDGPKLPERFGKAIAEGRRGGAILFKRNLPDLPTATLLCREIRGYARADLPLFLGVDQEGGRVTRLPPPFLVLPPMRVLGEIGDMDLIRRAARAVGKQLAAIGFNLDFAPVLDVDSNPQNPVIGDRSFGRDPDLVARAGVAFTLGLQDEGVLACGKHFPGHGDTSVDSHVDLPFIAHDRARLDRVELPPFRAAAGAGLATMMSAHVVCEGLDAGPDGRTPATLSRAICTDLLRGEIGFYGALFSDDLEMAAVAARYPVEDSAVMAIEAGCDVLLVCKEEGLADRAHEALVKQAERSPAFRRRCVEALDRGLRVRRQATAKPADPAAIDALHDAPEARAILDEIARKRIHVERA